MSRTFLVSPVTQDFLDAIRPTDAIQTHQFRILLFADFTVSFFFFTCMSALSMSDSLLVYDRSMLTVVGLTVAILSLVVGGLMLDGMGLRGVTTLNVFAMTCMAATMALCSVYP